MEVGGISSFPDPWNLITFVPVLLVALIVHGWRQRTWAAAFVLGFIFDSFSPLPAGSFTIIFLSLVILLRWLFQRWFSNRSWVSLSLLTVIGILFFFSAQIVIRLLVFVVTKNELLIVSSSEALRVLWLGTALSAAASLLITAAAAMTRRFIIRKHILYRYV